MMIEVSSKQSRSQFYIHAECCCRCCCCAVLLYCCYRCSSSAAISCCCSSSCAGWPKLLLVHWIWSQCFLYLHSNAIYFWCTLWQYCVAFIYGLVMPTTTVITGMHGAKEGVSPPRPAPLEINRFFRRNTDVTNMLLWYDTWYMHCCSYMTSGKI